MLDSSVDSRFLIDSASFSPRCNSGQDGDMISVLAVSLLEDNKGSARVKRASIRLIVSSTERRICVYYSRVAARAARITYQRHHRIFQLRRKELSVARRAYHTCQAPTRDESVRFPFKNPLLVARKGDCLDSFIKIDRLI